jgi:hypothetical protein
LIFHGANDAYSRRYLQHTYCLTLTRVNCRCGSFSRLIHHSEAL